MPQLNQLTLTSLFNALRNQLPPELQRLVDTAEDLQQPAGSGKFPVLEASDEKLEVTDGQVKIFDQPFSISGKLAADLLVHEQGAEEQILAFQDPTSEEEDQGEVLTAPQGQVLSELKFVADAGISGTFEATPSGGLTLSANAAAGGGLTYRHLRPSPTDATRLVALQGLLTSSRPPGLVPLALDEIDPSEIHVLTAKVNFDLGLDVTFGGNVKLQTDLSDLDALAKVFQGMSAEVKVDADYSLKASFGYSLYQQMLIAVGRFNLVDDNWLRMRIQRLRRSELTLGAQLDLQVEYDLAKDSLVALYDRILALDPTTNFMNALKEVQELRASGGWDAIRDKLVSTVGDEVDKLLDSVDWRQWVSDQDAAKIDGLLDELQKIITAYDELPDKIRSLWDTLLSEANLGPDSKILAALEKVKAIDPNDPTAVLEDLLDDDWKNALSLLEQFTGLSLDDLLSGQLSAISGALTKAQKLATTALNFLDEVPAKAIGLIQSFADRTGIEPAVTWLRANATSVDDLLDALKTKANEQIQNLVSRLIGKAWDALDADDLEKLGKWLDRIEAILDKKEEWEKKIGNYLNNLEGELGFSFGLEMSRLSERSALVDLEFDPSKTDVKKAVADALDLGQAKKLLAELPEADTLEQAGYRIREAVFSSRRIRTSAMSVFFSLFGLQKGKETRRIDEETIRVTQDGGRLVRDGSYQGGTVRTLRDDSDKAVVRTRELGAWLSMRATGSGGDVESPYDKGMQEQGLRMTFARRDDNTQAGEIAAMQTLLTDLGFPVTSADLAPVSGMPFTDLTLSLGLDESAVEAFFASADAAGWNTDCLNAGHRWFDEELIRFKKKRDNEIRKIRTGLVSAAVLENAEFQSHWLSSSSFLSQFGPATGNNLRSIRVSVAGQSVSVPITRRLSPGKVQIMLRGIFEMVESRGRSLNKLTDAQANHAGLATSPDPKVMRKLASQFSTAMARTPFQGKTEPNVFPAQWPSTMFDLWLAFTRVGRIDALALAKTRGLATLRFKATSEDDWQDPPLRWQLTDGLPAAALPRLFPIAPQTPDAVASKNSKLFHASLDCPGAASIKKKNRVFGALAREGRTSHDDCHTGS